jgi:hypothetical protein
MAAHTHTHTHRTAFYVHSLTHTRSDKHLGPFPLLIVCNFLELLRNFMSLPRAHIQFILMPSFHAENNRPVFECFQIHICTNRSIYHVQQAIRQASNCFHCPVFDAPSVKKRIRSLGLQTTTSSLSTLILCTLCKNPGCGSRFDQSSSGPRFTCPRFTCNQSDTRYGVWIRMHTYEYA